MDYPIDVLYLGSKGKVLAARTLRPRKIGPLKLSATEVVELAEGEIARIGVEVGDVLRRVSG